MGSKPGICEIAKPTRGAYSTPSKPPVAMAYVLMHIGSCSMAIKPNPSWKAEVSKSAWIKPCKLHQKKYLLKTSDETKQPQWDLKVHKWYTHADLKIPLYVCVHMETISSKFHIPSPQNFWLIYRWRL